MFEFENHGLVKPRVNSDGGLVVTKHPIASEIGASILRRGGNAVDAAIAAAFAVGVVEPYMSGLGGVGVGLWWDGERAIEVDGYTKVPENLDVGCYPLAEGDPTGLFGWPQVKDDRNIHGPLSVAVPTIPAMMQWLHQQGGTLPWAELLGPAIQLAKEGFAADWLTALNIVEASELLCRYPSTASVFLPQGRVPKAGLSEAGGERIVQPDLADSLEAVAREGAQVIYRGVIAERIVEFIGTQGGFLSADDLSKYNVRIAEPLRVPFGDSTVYLPSGLNGGPTVAEILQMMSLSDWKQIDWGTSGLFSHWIQSGLVAFEDRFQQFGCHQPSAPVWTKEYVLSRLGQNDVRPEIEPHHATDSTTHLAVVDKNGHGVCLTMTLLARWGSHLVVPGTGILLNNGLMWCDPRPGKPNSLAPGAVPLANMAPALVTHRGLMQGLVGSTGGRRIIGANAQILFNLLVHKMDPQMAVSAPRVDFSGSPILLDSRIPHEVQEKVRLHTGVSSRSVAPAPGRPIFASPAVIWGTPGDWNCGVDPLGMACGASAMVNDTKSNPTKEG